MAFVDQSTLITAAIAGKVVSFPTDTVPALAVKPANAQLIYDLKQRTPDKPLILMAASPDDIWDYVDHTPADRHPWEILMQRHWPGELTVVLPATTLLPPAMNPTQDGTIGIRIPRQAIALEILQQTGPLATTSANLSGHPPLRTLNGINQCFPSVKILDNFSSERDKPMGNGQPSTVAQWDGQGWIVLRQGRVQI